MEDWQIKLAEAKQKMLESFLSQIKSTDKETN